MSEPNDQRFALVPGWVPPPVMRLNVTSTWDYSRPEITETVDPIGLACHLAGELVAAIKQGQKRFEDLPPTWLTVEQAASYLNLSPDTIERLAGSGKLQSAEIRTDRGKGKRSIRRFKREWLDEFMDGSCPPTPPPPPATPQKRCTRRFGDHIK